MMVSLDIVRKTSYHGMRGRNQDSGEPLRQYNLTLGVMIYLGPARVSSSIRGMREAAL